MKRKQSDGQSEEDFRWSFFRPRGSFARDDDKTAQSLEHFRLSPLHGAGVAKGSKVLEFEIPSHTQSLLLQSPSNFFILKCTFEKRNVANNAWVAVKKGLSTEAIPGDLDNILLAKNWLSFLFQKVEFVVGTNVLAQSRYVHNGEAILNGFIMSNCSEDSYGALSVTEDDPLHTCTTKSAFAGPAQAYYKAYANRILGAGADGITICYQPFQTFPFKAIGPKSLDNDRIVPRFANEEQFIRCHMNADTNMVYSTKEGTTARLRLDSLELQVCMVKPTTHLLKTISNFKGVVQYGGWHTNQYPFWLTDNSSTKTVTINDILFPTDILIMSFNPKVLGGYEDDDVGNDLWKYKPHKIKNVEVHFKDRNLFDSRTKNLFDLEDKVMNALREAQFKENPPWGKLGTRRELDQGATGYSTSHVYLPLTAAPNGDVVTTNQSYERGAHVPPWVNCK